MNQSTESFSPIVEVGLDRALTDVAQVQRSLLALAELFREGRSSEANRLLAKCTEVLQRFTKTMRLARAELSLDFRDIHLEGIPLSSVESDFLLILENLLQSQEDKSEAGVADRIEYELLPNLCMWSKCLRGLGTKERNINLGNR